MHRALRQHATVLALVAMLLRAFIPAGWMPSSQPGAPLAFCTAGGMLELPASAATDLLDAPATESHPAPDPGHCVFAGTALAAPPGSSAGIAISDRLLGPILTHALPAHRQFSLAGVHPARAPPVAPAIA